MFKSKTDRSERGVLHLENCRLKRHKFKDRSRKYYGFQLIAKGNVLSFYLDNEAEREIWLKKLSLSAV